jgi:hypothetical protein
MNKRLEELLRGLWRPSSICSIEGEGDGAAAGGGDAGGAAPELSSAEKALEFWDSPVDANKVEGGQGGGEAGKAGAGAAADGESKSAEGDGAQKSADGQPAIPDEQLQADPRYKEVAQFCDEVQPILDQHGIPDAKELGLALADAGILYQIAGGQAPPSRLLDVMIQNSGWSKEQVSGVAADLIGWLTKQGFLKGDQAGQQRGTDGKFVDPLEEKVNGLAKTLEEQKANETRAAEQQRQTKIFDSFRGKIGELIEAKGLDKDDLDYYGREIRALIDPKVFNAVVARIEKGNFVDVQKLFDQVHSREAARLKRYTDKQLSTATQRQNAAPRVPAGGAPPAPKAGQQKRDLSNREERLAAAEAEWEK